jgi:uncharacterized SAM-binding protein YcdF (DUF218 family)
MFFLYKMFGLLIIPPGLFCIVMMLCSGAVFYSSRKKLLPSLILLFAVAIWFMSTPFGSLCITGPVESEYLGETLPANIQPCAVVVLGSGFSYNDNGSPVAPSAFALERVVCGIKAAERYRCPLIFAGGDVYGNNGGTEAKIMYDTAKELGWHGKTFLEDKSRTTKENILNSAQILDKIGCKNVILVTSAFHMRRAVAAAAKYMPNIKIFPYTSARLTRAGFHGASDLLPDAFSLMTSCLGIKERVGLLAIQHLQD